MARASQGHPGKYDALTRRRFHKLRFEDGLSIKRAAETVGVSEATGKRWAQGLGAGSPGQNLTQARQKMQGQLPDPRTFAQLPDPAKRALEDFNVFSELYLARHPSPWRRRVADQSVELLMDKTERHYVVCNLPPGVGKSTLWTLDIPLWLACGGGFNDPVYGRALRFMLGHASKQVSEHYVLRLRRLFELTRPYYDKEQKRYADRTLTLDFGRFKPDTHEGEERIWAKDQFLLAQLGEVDLYEKESTFAAVSMGSEFIGERCDYAAWDDLATEKTSRDIDIANAQAQWFEKEAESRVEPGGVLWLVGQRLGPLDLFRARLNEQWVDDDGASHQKYIHIVFPAHNEATCEAPAGGEHRQWDTREDGCLLDEERLPWREVMKLRGSPHFRTVYQQEDTDPSQVLVLPVWIEGGVDAYGEDVPGCYDHDRSFFEWPNGVRLINYAAVDVAAGGWWAVEWWALEPNTRLNYLIYGLRARLPAGGPQGFLDWDESTNRFQGVMNKLQESSIAATQPIRVWIVEANAAQRHLFQYNHFQKWRKRFWGVEVIPHQTQRNKIDPVLGVEGHLPMRYRNGMKRLPRSNKNPDSLNFIGHFVHELTTYPNCKTTDTVMSDWMGEFHIEDVIRLGGRPLQFGKPELHLPPYLERQRREMRLRAREEAS